MELKLYLGSAIDFLGRAEYRSLLRKVAGLVYSETAGVEVRKDLTGDFRVAERRREPVIRPATLADVIALVGTEQADDADADELWQRRLRRHVAAKLGVDACFVAEVDGVGPAFMHYLFMSEDQERLMSAFPGLFPILAADEAILEFLYVSPRSRNPGLAVDCVVQMTDEARRRGATSVISFINPSNKGALFVNHLAGFQAYAIRRSKRRFFRRTYTFEDWPADTSRSLVDLASGRARIT